MLVGAEFRLVCNEVGLVGEDERFVEEDMCWLERMLD